MSSTPIRLGTPGSDPWPRDHQLALDAMAALHGSYVGRSASLAAALAGCLFQPSGTEAPSGKEQWLALARLAAHLSEAGFDASDKTGKLDVQIAQLFPDWTPRHWISLRHACALMRAEFMVSLDAAPSPQAAPWLRDKALLRLLRLAGAASIPDAHGAHFANLSASMAQRSRPGFAAFLVAQGMPWTPAHLTALAKRASDWERVHRPITPRPPSWTPPPDLSAQEIAWGVAELARRGQAPQPMAAALCWLGMRPDLAQILLSGGAGMVFASDPRPILEKMWADASLEFKTRAHPRRAETLAHALSAWEALSMELAAPAPARASPQPTRL